MEKQSPVPDNESDRLQQLRELMVLDSEPEPAFDSLVRMAADICGVPVALISLIDENRQWFKAQTGLTGVTETPRDRAFCAHTIMGEGVLEVPDATVDERFNDNPLVTRAPDIRFYAGAPLQLPGGQRMGTLCVIDRIPRELSDAQRGMLRSLAQIVTETLLMRRDLIVRTLSARSRYELALSTSESQHRAIVEEQTELISLAQPDGTLVYVNPAYGRHFGRLPADMLGTDLYSYIDAADRAIVRDRVAWVMSTGTALKAENRMVSAQGDEVWVAWTNSVQVQADGGKLLRSVGRDISDRKRAEAALRASEAFLQRSGRVAGVGGWELDLVSSRLFWSEQTRRIHEVPDNFQPTLASAVGFYAEEARTTIEDAVSKAVQIGQSWDLELPLVTYFGRAIWVRAVGEAEFEQGHAVRLIGAFQDITARKQLEQRMVDSERFVVQITDSLPVRIAYLDREGRFLFINKVHCERFGRSRSEILGHTREELLGATDVSIQRRVAAVLGGTAQRFDFDETSGGKLRRIESRLIPDFDSAGNVKGFFSTGVDITERSVAEQAQRVLTTLLEVSTDFVFQADHEGRVLYMNAAAKRVLGLAPEAPVQGQRVVDFITDESRELLHRVVMPAVKLHGVWQGETSVQTKNGARIEVSQLVIAHRSASGHVERYSGVLRDISAQKAAREELQLQTATLQSVTEALPAIVSSVDLDLRFRFVNTAFEKWHGLKREHVLGKLAPDLLPAEDLERSMPWAQRALAGETVQFERHYPLRPGQPTLAVSYIPLRLPSGQLDGFVGVAIDITPHRQEQSRLQDLAHRDPLTGLYNRAGFSAHMQRSLRNGEGPELALLYIDLDHFKAVNDSHGHTVGDRLLQAFGQRLTKLVRPTDACARLGGDEFAVLLHGVRQIQAAQAVAHKVLDAAHALFTLDGHQLRLGASLGVALGATEADDGRGLMARADAQLMRAKQGGRGVQVSEDPH